MNIYKSSLLKLNFCRSHHIYNSADQQVLGPYSKEEHPAFSALFASVFQNDETAPDPSGKVRPEITIFERPGAMQIVQGPFWSKNVASDDVSYTVWSSDGAKHLEGFDKANVSGFEAVEVFKDGLMSLLDENLNLIYSGWFEAGAAPAGDIAPVKIDGQWKLICFSSSMPNLHS